MNILKLLITASIILISTTTVSAENQSATEIMETGTRIGKLYYKALRAEDTAGQNAALAEFNEILSTMRNQADIDIFTAAFTRSNIDISTPEKDARLYSRAVIKATRACDSIGVIDANDIATTVILLYKTERPVEEAKQYHDYYMAAITASQLGYEASEAKSDDISASILNHAAEQRATYATDSVAAKIWDDCIDFHSIRLSSIEEDAAKYADSLKAATKSGSQEQLDATARIIGFVYERYYLDRSEAEAKQFNDRVNELYEQQ